MRALLWGLALALAVAAPAQAGPLGAAIGSISAAFAGSGIGAALLRMAAGFVLSALAKSLQPKPKQPGIKTNVTQTGGINPASLILGRYATGGAFVAPPMSHGDDNRYLTYVIDLADMPITALDAVYLDGEAVPFDGAVHADYGTAATGRVAGRAWLKFYDGTQTVADPMLLAKYGSYPDRPWSSDMILRGVPYAILTFEYDREVFNGLPQARFELRGIPLYDPRLDTSVGGSGAQRWADPATWAYTDNPVVMVYNIVRGITLPDGDMWGIGAAAEDLPLSQWFAAMNACDEMVAVGAGTTKRYRAGLEITVDQEPQEVIGELMEACGGEVLEAGGYWHVTAGAPPPAVAFITDADIVISDPSEYAPFPSLASTYNAVTATYPDPGANWEPVDAVPLYNAGWETEDGDRRLVASLQLDAAPYPAQVRRLMREMAADNRRMRSHVITLPPSLLHVMPLDTVSWTSTYNRYTSKLFEVQRKVIDPATLCSAVLVRERDPSDYDVDGASDAVVPTPPAGSVIQPQIVGVDQFSVAGVAIPDASGTGRRPAIRMTWNPAIVADGLGWVVRVKATGAEVARGTTADIAAGTLTVATNGILPAVQYEVQARAVSRRTALWTVWLSVTTPDVRLSRADVDTDMQDLIDTAIRGAVQTADFAAGIRPVEIVSSLPTTGLTAGRVVYLTTNGKLYRYNGGWTAAVPATDVTGQIVSTQITDGAIITPKLAAGSVVTDKLASASVVSDKLAANSVIAGKVAAAAIGTNELAARAATVEKLAIRDFTNLVQDPGFEDGALGWTLGTGFAVGTSASFARTGDKHINRTASDNSSAASRSPLMFDLSPGDVFYIEAYVRPESAFAATSVGVRIAWRDTAGATLSYSSALLTTWTVGQYQRVSGKVTAPAGAAYGNFEVVTFGQTGGTVRWDDCRCHRANAGRLIVDGSIVSQHLDTASLGVAGIGIFGGTLKSSNFVSGSAGWQITNAGNAEFNTVIARTSNIAANAVTENHYTEIGAVTLGQGNPVSRTLSITTNADNGAELAIIAFAPVTGNVPSSGGLYEIEYTIQHAGMTIMSFSGQFGDHPGAFTSRAQAGSGANIVSFTANMTTGDNTKYSQMSLLVLELKR